MSRPLLAPLAVVALLGCAGLVACQRETTPPLIQVLEVAPHEVEEGDHLDITGIGFPEGKVAHIAFRGDLHRPGAAPVRGVEVNIDTLVTSNREIDVPFDATLEKLFAGPPDRVAHTTFSGDVTVAFASSRPAAPPVAGTLENVWLDVRPPLPRRAVAEAEAAEGERTLAFLGMHPSTTTPAAGGVVIDSVDPGSRAESGRLLAGDVITEFDGVRVLTLRDVIPTPGERTAWLKIRRGGDPHEDAASLSLLGFKPQAAASMLGPVLILGLTAALLLLFLAPTPRALAWLEETVSTRLRPRAAHPRAPKGGALRGLTRHLGSRKSAWLLFAGASATFALLPFAHFLGIGEVDVGTRGADATRCSEASPRAFG
jgi:NADH-quinone oxidoreductase subunit H